MATPSPKTPTHGIHGLLDRVHSALRGIDAANTDLPIEQGELDAVSDAVHDVEAFCRLNGVALSEWAGKLPDPVEAMPSTDTPEQDQLARQFRALIDGAFDQVTDPSRFDFRRAAEVLREAADMWWPKDSIRRAKAVSL